MTDPTTKKADARHRCAPSTDMLRAFWAELNTECPTDADCFAELLRQGSDSSVLTCQNCGSDQIQRDESGRVISCDGCQHTGSLTAGTFFHGIKCPRAWLAAVRLIERGMAPSTNQFHKLVDVAYDTAWNIYRKLGLLIERELPVNAETVPSRMFAAVISKRSRETPARHDPFAEVTILESFTSEETYQASAPQERSGQVPALIAPIDIDAILSAASGDVSATARATRTDKGKVPELAGKEKEVYDLLSRDPIHFDALAQYTGMPVGTLSATLSILELNHFARHFAGDWYVRLPENDKGNPSDYASRKHPHECITEAVQCAQDAIEYFQDTSEGLSRRYLQLCLAIFWCCVDKARWPRGSLLSACQRSDRITRNDVLAYVSPALLQIATA